MIKKQFFDAIDTKILKSFQVIKKVGQGAYGQVWKAKNKKKNNFVGLKKIYQAFGNVADAQKTYRQIRYLQKIHHPNIVRLLNYYEPLLGNDIYLQFEFIEADLSSALKNNLLKPIHKSYIFYQLVNAIVYLHSAYLIHRDIKPSNVLVNQNCQAKICDFGLIRSIKKIHLEDIVMTQNVATRWYRAPEVLLSLSTYGSAADIWSLGCVLAEMLLGRPIFQGSSNIEQLQKIIEFTGQPSEQDMDFIQNQVARKITQSISIAQKKSLKKLFSDQQRSLIDILEKIFQFNPRNRPSASQILLHPYISKFRGKFQQKIALEPIKIPFQTGEYDVKDFKYLLFNQQKPESPVNFHRRNTLVAQKQDQDLIMKTMPSEGQMNKLLHSLSFKKSQLNSFGSQIAFRFDIKRDLSPINRRTVKIERFSPQKQEKRSSPSFLKNRGQRSITPDKKAQNGPSIKLELIPVKNINTKYSPFKRGDSPKKFVPQKFTKVNIQNQEQASNNSNSLEFFTKKQSFNESHGKIDNNSLQSTVDTFPINRKLKTSTTLELQIIKQKNDFQFRPLFRNTTNGIKNNRTPSKMIKNEIPPRLSSPYKKSLEKVTKNFTPFKTFSNKDRGEFQQFLSQKNLSLFEK